MTTLFLIEVVHALRASRDPSKTGALTQVATRALEDTTTVAGAVGVAVDSAVSSFRATAEDTQWLQWAPCRLADDLARIFLAAGYESTAHELMAAHRTVPGEHHTCEIDKPLRLVGPGNSGG